MSRRARRFTPATSFFALLSLLLAAALYLKSCPPAPSPAPPPRPTRRPTTPARARTVPPVFRTPRPEERTKASPVAPRIAIVIDDLGNEMAPVLRIAGWAQPVTGAVLPDLRFSAEAARTLSRAGHEVLLHLPMEPEGYPKVRPGPGVVLKSQSDDQIAETLQADLASVPGAVGVNNHMGSAATADARVMRAVTRVLSARGLFFLDSRTTDATVAERTASEGSVRTVARRIFLDDAINEGSVRTQVAELLRRARQEQFAVAIGHPYPVTLSVLERELPRLQEEEGVRLVKVSELAK
ncbi:MAG: divergent polysaccharide deacetylase family protein [Acidobacteriota bacterium]